MKKKKIPISMIIFTACGFILTAVLLYIFGAMKTTIDYVTGIVNAVICLLNLITGILIINDAVKKSNKIFMLEFFGSMLLRMILILIYVVISIKLFGFPILNFIFSFFGFYIFSLIYELYYLSGITKKEINKGEDNI